MIKFVKEKCEGCCINMELMATLSEIREVYMKGLRQGLFNVLVASQYFL